MNLFLLVMSMLSVVSGGWPTPYSISEEPDNCCPIGTPVCLVPTSTPTVTPTPKIKCHTPLDISIVIDRSGSIGNSNIGKIKLFAKNFIDNFSIGDASGAEFSITQFNTNVEGLLSFSFNKTEIINAIDQVGDSSGWTNTAGAITFVTKNYLPYSRTNVSLFLVLITDGVPRLGVNSAEVSKQNTIDQTNTMKDLFPSVRVVPVKVGNFDQSFLEEISDINDIFSVDSYSDLDDILLNITKEICVYGGYTRNPTNYPTKFPITSYPTSYPTTGYPTKYPN
jgi:hypothetical protein